jgi:type VI secretion system protein ImpK
MSLSGDDFDEPTVVGRRPIGPSRAPRREADFYMAPSAPPPRVAPPVSSSLGGDLLQPGPLARNAAPPVAAPETSVDREDVFVSAASQLLIVVAHLRDSVSQADISSLRKEMAEQLRRFEEKTLRLGARAGDVSAARYALCSLVDETVMTTPWGASSGWSANSLLHELHGETWGGEKVFSMLERIRGEPAKYLGLLKLMEMCLLLGFEGKYRVLDGGRDQIVALRSEIGRLLRQHARPSPSELSPAWRGVAQSRTLRRYVPLWVVFAVAGAIIVCAYGAAKWRIVDQTVPADKALQDIVKS